jgi:hypothetical protein
MSLPTFIAPSPEIMRDPVRASRWFWSQREEWHAACAEEYRESNPDKAAWHEDKRLHAQGYLKGLD